MKFGKRLAFSLLIGLTALGLTACSSESAPVDNTKVTLNAQSVEMDYYQTTTLVATVENSTQELVWTSSDEEIAVVENGIVTPTEKDGRVTITATVGNTSASCVVNVVKSGYVPVLELSQTELSLDVGDSFTVLAETYFKGAILDGDFEYAVSIADGAQSGVVQAEISKNQATFTALAVGETTYQISTVIRDLPLVQQVKISVNDEEEIVFLSGNLRPVQGGFALDLGLTETEEYKTEIVPQISAYKNGVKVNDFAPEWQMEETGIFALQDGAVSALKEGNGVMTATFENVSVCVYVNVIRPKIILVDELVLEAVNSQADLPVTLNGELQTAFLQKEGLDKAVINGVKEQDGKLLYDKTSIPKLATMLGKQTLTIETDKAVYECPVDVYTMIIHTEAELNALIPTAKEQGNGTYWSGYYVLGGDITCTGEYVSQWDGTRVGEDALWDSTGFYGVFDGRGYTIFNFKTTGTTGGLIPCLNAGGVIKNLSLVNASNTGKGGLVSSLCCGTIENVYVSVSVKGEKGTRDRNYTSAFVSDVISTARISKIFVDVLEKTGNTAYCNPFYRMHEGFGIVNSFYALGTDILWEKSQWEGTKGEAQDVGAYADLVSLKTAGVDFSAWANEFWTTYNGLPYPQKLPLPTIELTITLSQTKVTAGKTVFVTAISGNTLVQLSEEAAELGVTLLGNAITVPETLVKGDSFTVYASNVYEPTKRIEITVEIISENDLQQGEFDNDDIWE